MAQDVEKDTEGQNEDVYELVLPPGIPSKIIIAVCKEFNTDVVSAYADVETGLADITSRDLLAFRADKETIEKIRQFVVEETRKFIDE
ncbi:MAG: hypothetical protein ACXWET_01265 [Halobacteriota archaeon]|jgi:hypothetical protein|nr:hypothetical protein [Euryarchaeota archaeon]